MKIGLDYWQVISHYPEYFHWLAARHLDWGDEVHVISAVGNTRNQPGAVQEAVDKLGVPYTQVHQILFQDPKESPEVKLRTCQALGIEVFYDDRDDVCRLLNKNGILAMRVTRKDNSTYDLEADQK